MAEFKERLKELRLKNEFSSAEVLSKKIVEKLGEKNYISPNTIRQYEKNTIPKNFRYIEILANFFNVSTEYMQGLTDEPTINIDIKAIYQKYGLTEQTLKNLEYWNNKEKYILKNSGLKSPINTINKILSEKTHNKSDVSIIELIDMYLKTKISDNYLLSFQGDIVQLFNDFNKVPNKHYGGEFFITGDLLIKGILVEIENKLIKMKEGEKDECKGTRKK